MVKQMIAKLLMSIALISINTLSVAQPREMSFGYSIDYIFKPNEPKIIVNNFFFTIEAKCLIKATDESDDIIGKILNGTGSLNSNQLNTGEELTITVRHNDTLHIIAPSGVKVKMTNLGINEVTAVCYPA